MNTQPSPSAADRVLPPPLTFVDAGALAQLAATLAQLPGPVALEIAAEAGGRGFLVRGTPAARAQVAAGLYAVYDQVEVAPAGAADPAARFRTGAVCGARLRLAGPEYLPLKTWREFENQDPLRPLLAAGAALGPDEAVLAQLVVHGAAPEGWARPHLRQLASLQRRGYGAELAAPAAPARPLESTLGTLAVIGMGLVLVWAGLGSAGR